MAKVLKEFRDKFTNRIYEIGDEFNGERQEYLSSLGYIEAEEKKERKKKKKEDE